VVQALFDPADASVHVARAGHLPPLVIPAHGAPHFVGGDPAPPIGVGLLREPPPTVRIQLGLMDTIMFFTDGLVERRRTPTDVTMTRLREFVGTLTTRTAQLLCDEVLARFVEAGGGDDDVAMLAIRPLFHVPARP
jgi:serine phosphatase RsbU (regulator of sigma subunit)